MAKAVKVVNVENLSAEERGSLLAALREVSNSLSRMDGEKDLIRETKKKIAKDLKLPNKLVSKLAKVYHKQNFDEEMAEHEQFENLYLKLTNKATTPKVS